MLCATPGMRGAANLLLSLGAVGQPEDDDSELCDEDDAAPLPRPS